MCRTDAVSTLIRLLVIGLPMFSMLASTVSIAATRTGSYEAIGAEAIITPVSSVARYTASESAKKYGQRRGLVRLGQQAFGRVGLRDQSSLKLQLFSDLTVMASRRHIDIRSATSYSWFGGIDNDPYGMVVITRIGDLIAAYVAHADGNYWVFPRADGFHEVLQLDESTFPASYCDEPDKHESNLRMRRPSHYGVDSRKGHLVDYRKTTVLPDRDLRIRRPSSYDVNENAYEFLPDNGSVIDVLVLFTPAAAERALADWNPRPSATLPDFFTEPPSEPELIWLRAQIGIDLANASFRNSGIKSELRVVSWPLRQDYSVEAHIGADSALAALDDLRNDGDGVLDDVHHLRNFHAADIVVMITDDLLYANGRQLRGRVYDTRKKLFNQYPDTQTFESAQAANAFAVISIDSVAKYTVAHEIGHLLGARHDHFSYNSAPSGNYEQDGHGYTLIRGADAVRTVMAYPDKCNIVRHYYFGGQDYPCPVVGFWSDPANTIFGDPLGIVAGYSQPANNARVLNQNRIPVSQYRWSACRFMDCP